jgi:hypothetical protein
MFESAIFRLQLPAAGRQTKAGIFIFLIILSSLACSQIWLSLGVYDSFNKHIPHKIENK